MAQHTVTNLGSMHGFQIDSHVKNIVAKVDLDNGSHVVIDPAGGLVAGEIDYYNVVAPTDVANEVVMIMVHPEIVSLNGYNVGILGPDGVAGFYNPANKVSGGYIPGVGDDLVITSDGFSAAPTVGQFAIPANGSFKLAPAADATATAGSRLVYLVTKQETINIGTKRIPAYRLLVVKA